MGFPQRRAMKVTITNCFNNKGLGENFSPKHKNKRKIERLSIHNLLCHKEIATVRRKIAFLLFSLLFLT